jgi:hypothetical protein
MRLYAAAHATHGIEDTSGSMLIERKTNKKNILLSLTNEVLIILFHLYVIIYHYSIS